MRKVFIFINMNNLHKPNCVNTIKMSFGGFCLFLILLQNRFTEQTTEGTIESTTDNNSSNSGNADTETTLFTEPTSDWTTYEPSTISSNIENSPSTKPTTEESTENSNSMETQTLLSTEPISEGTTDDSNTNSTVSNTPKPLIQYRVIPSDVSQKSENRISNQQENKSYEKNFSTASVFGIVLASIIGTVAVFYIIVSLIRNYKTKSYIVRSPSMELGQT